MKVSIHDSFKKLDLKEKIIDVYITYGDLKPVRVGTIYYNKCLNSFVFRLLMGSTQFLFDPEALGKISKKLRELNDEM